MGADSIRVALPEPNDAYGSKPWLLGCVVVAALLALTEQVVYRSELTIGPGVYVLWPNNGVALALLLVFGWRCWPGALLGYLVAPFTLPLGLANLFADLEPSRYIVLLSGTVAVDVVHVTAVAWLVRRVTGRRSLLGDLPNAVACTLSAGFAGPVFNTALSMLVLWAVGRVTTAQLPAVSPTWFAAEFLGAMVFAPTLIIWSRRPVLRWVGRHWLVFAAVVLVLVVATWVGFSTWEQWLSEGTGLNLALVRTAALVLVLPAMALIVLRFAQAGAVLGATIVSVIAILGTVRGHGPFKSAVELALSAGVAPGRWLDPLTLAVIELQLVLSVTGGTAIVVGAIVSERARQRSDLQKRGERLRRLTQQLVETEDRERRELATRLHDGMHQYLAVARMSLDDESGRVDAPSVRKARDAISQAEHESRSVINDLAPPALTALGLHAALDQLVRKFEGEFDLPVLYKAEPPAVRPVVAVEAFLYRAAHELLINAVKHANASRAGIAYAADADAVRLTVWDDGPGFDLDAALEQNRRQQDGFGLFSVHEQAASLGGRLRVSTDPHFGLTLTLPGKM